MRAATESAGTQGGGGDVGRQATAPGSAAAAATAGGAPRLVSLDAFRGAVMLLMASSGLGLAELARSAPGNRLLSFLASHAEHAAWRGCTVWDLIQPVFMLMVGVALPWSLAGRARRGESAVSAAAWWRVLRRSAALVLLAVFLSSAWSARTEWVFTNVLAQIGLGYPFLHALALRSRREQVVAGGLILAGYWLWFALGPVPGPGFDWASVGVSPDWKPMTGFAAHWEKNTNPAAAFDRWFLNLFPREKPHLFSSGGYQTLNAVPSLVTMLWGVAVGQRWLAGGPASRLLRDLAWAGVAGVAAGWLLDAAGLCPMVKRIWTPSWTLYSAGWSTLLLAAMHGVLEVRVLQRWAWPLVVAGRNPITLYVMWQLMGGFVRKSLTIHLGPGVFAWLGPVWVPCLERVSVVAVFWVVLAWMHRRGLYLRL